MNNIAGVVIAKPASQPYAGGCQWRMRLAGVIMKIEEAEENE